MLAQVNKFQCRSTTRKKALPNECNVNVIKRQGRAQSQYTVQFSPQFCCHWQKSHTLQRIVSLWVEIYGLTHMHICIVICPLAANKVPWWPKTVSRFFNENLRVRPQLWRSSKSHQKGGQPRIMWQQQIMALVKAKRNLWDLKEERFVILWQQNKMSLLAHMLMDRKNTLITSNSLWRMGIPRCPLFPRGKNSSFCLFVFSLSITFIWCICIYVCVCACYTQGLFPFMHVCFQHKPDVYP